MSSSLEPNLNRQSAQLRREQCAMSDPVVRQISPQLKTGNIIAQQAC